MTEKNYFFDYKSTFSSEDEIVLFNGLNNNALKKKGMDPVTPYGIFIRDEEGEVVGGVSGFTMYGCIYIDMLWIDEEIRHKGLGHKIIADVEAIGHERKCTFMTVTTMDWEALLFYQSCGFDVEFVREGYDNQSKMYLLRKAL